MAQEMNRRRFLGVAAGSVGGFSIVPRHVLGGAGHIAPSEKVTLANIGCGTQGLTEMMGMLASSGLQIVAVCDPNKESQDYVEWHKDSVRRRIADGLGRPDWRRGADCPGGRDVGKEIVELYYAGQSDSGRFQGCASCADYRELLEKERDLDAVKVITPDHLHAIISIAAMRKGKHVVMHKPLANRVDEARLVVETARRTKVATHFLAASTGGAIRQVAGWIRDGAIGTLREIHNWSNRPVWPQYAKIPTDRPPVPPGFDWDLWLGPSLPRPYHPHYTHAVFRGWYEFGGGPIADMGHYSLWPVFQEFELDAPVMVESTPSHVCEIRNNVSTRIRNDYTFPFACTIRFRFAAKGERSAIDLYWHDGGMRPPTPEEVEEDNRELPAEGMMFVGDQGKILGGFRGENARIIPERKFRAFQAARDSSTSPQDRARRTAAWVKALRAGKSTFGDFLLGGPISEAVNLGAVSLRLGGRRLIWDAKKMRITNLPEANKYLTRECRKGWELT